MHQPACPLRGRLPQGQEVSQDHAGAQPILPDSTAEALHPCTHLQGHRKPSPESFQSAVQHLQLPSSDLLLIDDRQPNVDGAKSMGLQAIKFENAAQLEVDLREFGLVF
jgi:hypothetical protein